MHELSTDFVNVTIIEAEDFDNGGLGEMRLGRGNNVVRTDVGVTVANSAWQINLVI